MGEKYKETCFSSNVAGGSPALESCMETRLKGLVIINARDWGGRTSDRNENIYNHYVGLRNQTYNKCWGTNFYNCLERNENGENNTYLLLK